MQLKKLIVSNFTSYKEPTEFNFDMSPIFIIGPNGSGKSSIVDAISVAFFRKPVRSSSLTALVNNESDTAKIVLEFELDGKQYRIERYIGKKSTNKHDKLIDLESDVILVQGAQNVTQELEKLVGNFSSWVTLVPQRTLVNILKTTELRDIFYTLFNINKIYIFSKALNKIDSQLKAKESVYIEQKQDIELKLSDIKNQIFLFESEKELKSKYNELKKRYDELLSINITEEVKQVTQELAEANQLRNRLLQHKSIYDATKHLSYLLEYDLKKIENQLREAYEIKQRDLSESTIRQLLKIDVDKVKSLISHMELLTQEKHAIISKLRQLAQRINKLKRLHSAYHKYDLIILIKASKTNVQFATPFDEVKASALKVLKFLVDTFEFDVNEDLSNISDPSLEDFKLIVNYKKYVDTIKNLPSIKLSDDEVTTLSQFKNWQEVRDEINKLLNEAQFLSKKLTKQHRYCDKVLEKLKQVPTDYQFKFIESYEDLQKYLKILDDLSYIQQYCSTFTEWKSIMTESFDESKLSEVESKIKTLEAKLEELNAKHDEIANELKKLQQEIESTKQKIITLQSLKKQESQLEEDLNKLKQTLQDLNKKIQKVDLYRNVLSELENHINYKFRNVVPILVKEILERFGFNIGISITESFEVKALIDDKVLPAQMLSGAQQSVLALALRYVISQLVGLRLPIILDEVTEGFDVNRIDLLKGFINSIAKQHQTFIISHDNRIISDSVGQIIQLG